MNKQEQIRQYLDQTFEYLAKINPKLASISRRQKANDRFLNAEADFEIVKQKIDKARQEVIEEYKKQIEARKKFIENMSRLNIQTNDERSILFGETLRPQLVALMKAYEQIQSDNNLSNEEKHNMFLQRQKEIVSTYTEKYKTLVARFTSDVDLQRQYSQGSLSGYDTISYETIENLYNIFINDINISGPESAAKMLSTIKLNEQVFMPDGTINPNLYDFSLMEEVFKFVQGKGKELKFHTILWHDSIPTNLQREILAMPKEQQRIATLSFFKDYISHLSDWATSNGFHFRQIDVLNEIASDRKTGDPLRESFWREAMGDDYYIEILKLAKEYFPNSELLYNDYNEYVPDKCDNMCEVIQRIVDYEKENGVQLLDGIGMQSHYSTFAAMHGTFDTTPEKIFDTTYKLSQFGKPLYRTEFDFVDMVSTIEQDETLSSNKKEEKIAGELENKEEIMEAIHIVDQYANVQGFIMWGNSDELSWRKEISKNAHPIDSLGTPKKEYEEFKQHYLNNQQRLTQEQQQKPEIITYEEVAPQTQVEYQQDTVQHFVEVAPQPTMEQSHDTVQTYVEVSPQQAMQTQALGNGMGQTAMSGVESSISANSGPSMSSGGKGIR